MQMTVVVARGIRSVGWAVLALVVIGPLYWVVSSSFKGRSEIILSTPTIFPEAPTLSNYTALFGTTDFLTYMLNSGVVSVATAVCTLAISTIGSYALYRMQIVGAERIGNAVLLSYMVPGALLLVPLYRTMASIRMIDTLASLVLVNIAFTAPFCVWLLRGFLEAIPRDLDESAALDGAGPVRILTRVILPLLLPGLGTVALYAFVYSWTEFTFASQLIVSGGNKTLPVGLSAILGQYNINWGLLMAGAVQTMVPAAILFGFVGRYFVRGLTIGAVR